VVVPLQELQIVVQKVLAVEFGVRCNEELSNLVELSNVDVGALCDIVIPVSRGP